MTTLLKNAWIYTPQGVIEGGCVVIDGEIGRASCRERV